jgi:hypothetical protein
MNDNEAYRPKLTIPGVPDSIPHATIIASLRSMGFNPDLVNSIEFKPDSVHVNLTAYKTDGTILIEDGQRAEHHVVIPISD